MNDKELDVMEKILQCKHVTAISSEKALELIDEIRGLKERNAQITQNYNKRVEKYYYLQQEVRRLKEEVGNQARELENTEREAEGIHQEGQLYKDLYTNIDTQNMKYKKALEIAKEEAKKEYIRGVKDTQYESIPKDERVEIEYNRIMEERE